MDSGESKAGGRMMDNEYESPYKSIQEAAQTRPDDYYAVLGVSETASSDEIKAAFRALARQFHPDKTGTDQSAVFNAISQAYHVVSNKQSRAAYDNKRAINAFEAPEPRDQEWLDPSGSRTPAGGFARGPAAPYANPFVLPKCSAYQTTAVISTQQVFTGTTVEVTIRRKVTCDHCKGTGGDSGRIEMCNGCQGSGLTVQRMRSAAEDHPSVINFSHGCYTCATTGFLVKNRTGFCAQCGGHGWRAVSAPIRAEVPPGVPCEGHRIVLKGQGHATPLRPPGDVHVDISVDWDPRLVRRGADVHAVFRIRLVDALCGFRYSGDYFGELMEFTSTPGQVIQTWDTLTVRGAGLPRLNSEGGGGGGGDDEEGRSRGDLLVTFHVDMPHHIDAKDQQLLRIILDSSPLRSVVSRDPIGQEELGMRDSSCATKHAEKDSRANGCNPM